jgi:hypothetical protein
MRARETVSRSTRLVGVPAYEREVSEERMRPSFAVHALVIVRGVMGSVEDRGDGSRHRLLQTVRGIEPRPF